MSIKIGATILIITAGAVGGFLIIKNSGPAAVIEKPQDDSIKKSMKADGNPLKWVEKAVGGLSDIFEKSPEENKAAPEINSPDNLTDLVGKIVAGQIKTLDQSGKGLENFDINSPEAQKIIQETIGNLSNPTSFFNEEINRTINDSQLKISNDNSYEAKSEYLMTTARIIKNNSNEFYNNPVKAFEKFSDYGDVSGIRQIADTYQNIFNGFLNTPIPSKWIDLHKRYLIFLKKAELTYRGIVDFQNDPIKAQILISTALELAKTELEIKQEYLNKSLNLDF
jgi:hypothetical protein